eukprot:4275364-Heterocapsa_arctica.AAC.1
MAQFLSRSALAPITSLGTPVCANGSKYALGSVLLAGRAMSSALLSLACESLAALLAVWSI